MDALSQVRKIVSEEVDYNSPVTSKLFTDIAGALNAFCNFTNGKCTRFNENGSYTTSPNASLVIVMAQGGDGGGGGGGSGAVLQYNGTQTSEWIRTFRVYNYGNDGQQGGSGGDAYFGTDIIAKGGNGGLGGGRIPPSIIVDESTNEDVVWDTSNLRFSLEGQIQRVTFSMQTGGLGGNGFDSGISTVGAPAGYSGLSHILGGLRGYPGQVGNYGFRVIKAIPSTTYAIQVGAPGVGGLGGAGYTQNVSGGSVTLSSAPNGSDAVTSGNVTVYEFGF